MIATRIYVDHPDLALSSTIRTVTDADIRVVSDVGTDPMSSVYTFQISAPDFDEVEAALRADHTVDDFSAVVEMAGHRTYRIEYSDDATLITPHVIERGGLTLASESYLDGWMIHLQLESHEDLYDLAEDARLEGIRFEILELTQNNTLDDQFEFGLTPLQMEALVAAYKHGLYDEPRQGSVEELAEVLDISRTAVSGRLRRGAATLIEELLLEEPGR